MTKTFTIGDHIYFPWFGDVYEAVIIDIDKGMDVKGIPYAIAKLQLDLAGGETHCKMSSIYKTEEECLNAIRKRSKKMVKEYKESIKDIKELVKFMHIHNISSANEYTEEEARRAACERAKELLNIDLEY